MMNDVQRNTELTERLQAACIGCANGQECSADDYKEARNHFMSNPRFKAALPQFVRLSLNLGQFWNLIQPKFETYKERRAYIFNEFGPLVERIQDQGGLVDVSASDTFESFSADGVGEKWRRALERLEHDPEGAITAARSLIESTCKHILDDNGVEYPASCELPDLWKRTAKELHLSPEQHSEAVFKQILGGCASVVNGLASVRNKLSDSHGQGRLPVRPAKRHATLSVNLAGSLCLFIVETQHELSKQKKKN